MITVGYCSPSRERDLSILKLNFVLRETSVLAYFNIVHFVIQNSKGVDRQNQSALESVFERGFFYLSAFLLPYYTLALVLLSR